MPGGASVLSRFREFSSVASGLPCPIGSPFPKTSSDRRGTRRVPSLFCRRPDEIVARSRSLLLTFYSKGPIFLQIIYRRDSWRPIRQTGCQAHRTCWSSHRRPWQNKGCGSPFGESRKTTGAQILQAEQRGAPATGNGNEALRPYCASNFTDTRSLLRETS